MYKSCLLVINSKWLQTKKNFKLRSLRAYNFYFSVYDFLESVVYLGFGFTFGVLKPLMIPTVTQRFPYLRIACAIINYTIYIRHILVARNVA